MEHQLRVVTCSDDISNSFSVIRYPPTILSNLIAFMHTVYRHLFNIVFNAAKAVSSCLFDQLFTNETMTEQIDNVMKVFYRGAYSDNVMFCP